MPWLFLAYPLLAHIATVIHDERLGELLATLALVVVFAVPMIPALTQRRLGAWLSLAGIAVLLYWAARGGWARYLLYIPSVLIPLSLSWVFARSLRAGETPLVTRIAAEVRGDMPTEVLIYTRTVTRLWAVLLAAIACCAVLLALFANPELWSLMTNFGIYVFMGALFLGEYLYRRWRFRHLPQETFRELVVALFTAKLH